MCRALNIAIFLLVLNRCNSENPLVIIRDLIQFNAAGHPVLHKELNYTFDPDVGTKRSRQYQELNGPLGEKAIERLGLGIDGNDQERLAQQRERDEGHLGGLNYLKP